MTHVSSKIQVPCQPDLLPSARGKLWSPCLVHVGFYNILLSDPLMKTCRDNEDCQEFAASAVLNSMCVYIPSDYLT